MVPLRWTDPSTLQEFLVDSRTGNSWRPRGQHDHGDACCGDTADAAPVDVVPGARRGIIDRSSLKRKIDESTAVMPEWMTKSLTVRILFEYKLPALIDRPTELGKSSLSASGPASRCHTFGGYDRVQ